MRWEISKLYHNDPEEKGNFSEVKGDWTWQKYTKRIYQKLVIKILCKLTTQHYVHDDTQTLIVYNQCLLK